MITLRENRSRRRRLAKADFRLRLRTAAKPSIKALLLSSDGPRGLLVPTRGRGNRRDPRRQAAFDEGES